MTGDVAYEGEMDDVALFQSALRAAVPTQPDPRIGQALVPRLAETARTAGIAASNGTTVTRAPRRRPRWHLVARVGIAAATIPLLFAGLAVAGVTVPQAAQDAFETVGVELPNQPAENGTEKGAATEKSQGTSGSPGAPATGELPPNANARAKANAEARQNGERPGRRVRRLGQGPIPGPASPPEGRALGHAKQESGGSTSSNAGGSGGSQSSGVSTGKGNASAQADSGGDAGGNSAAYGKPE